jgi:hypothetical protein
MKSGIHSNKRRREMTLHQSIAKPLSACFYLKAVDYSMIHEKLKNA